MPVITITDHLGNSTEAEAPAGAPLSRVVYTSGAVPAPPLCSGIGRCGLCRMRISPAPVPHADDLAFFSPARLQQGWRLGCRHSVSDGLRITLPHIPPVQSATRPAKTTGQLGLAVDLGTTSLHWAAVETAADTLSIVAQGQETNPQMGAGSEVMSRLAAAADPAVRGRLAALVKSRLAALTDFLHRETGQPVTSLCVAGNAAMTYILLDLPVEGLSRAPYRLDYRGDETVRLCGTAHNTDTPLPPVYIPPVYIPPVPAPFVGADISAGMAALLCDESAPPPYPFVLADLGTNGEFVLALSPAHSIVTSVAMGPALEGIGMTHGSMACPGAATAFSATPLGLVPAVLDAQGIPVVSPPASLRPADIKAGGMAAAQSIRSISGTGYLSLITVLLQTGVITPDGQFNTQPSSVAGRRLARAVVHDSPQAPTQGACLRLNASVTLSARDIEEILKVKAAFSLAFERLLCEASLSPADVRRVFLAGALGQHVSPADLETLGFLPRGLAQCTTAAGNTALRGAMHMLTRHHCRTRAAQWSAGAIVADLTSDPAFTTNFMRHMRFS
jgi:uncharacterized 2Fe-2S/4Fe-4S cluster protein (DUF4445 family)/ferredoxin